jgi:hypothetical protein
MEGMKADSVSPYNPHGLCGKTLSENEKSEILIPIVTGKQFKGLADCTTPCTIVTSEYILNTACYMNHCLSESSPVTANSL